MTLRLVYITLDAVIFLTEIAIAVGFIGRAFVRGSVGDILVIALIYFLLRAVLGLFPLTAVSLAITTGFLVEALQYVHLAELISLRKGSILYTVIGNTYSSSDLVMYLGGGILALAVDKYVLIPLFNERRPKPNTSTSRDLSSEIGRHGDNTSPVKIRDNS